MITTPKEIAKILREIADLVEKGDSFEGSLAYTYHPTQDDMLLDFSFRHGEGQGGVYLSPEPSISNVWGSI